MSNAKNNIHSMSEFSELFRELGNANLIVKNYPTGIASFDAILGGGLGAGIHTVCAAPGSGKTSLVLNIATNCAKNGTPVLMFSFEVPLVDLITKIYSYVSASAFDNHSFSFMDIRTNRVPTTAEQKKFTKVWEYIENNISKQITFIDCLKEPYSATEIATCIEEYITKNQKVPIIIVDYLQMIKSEDSHISTKNNIENAMTVLHAIAEKHGAAILAISSIAKQSSDTLTLFSAAEAARIAYSSVTVLGLEEATKTTNKSDDASYKTMILKVFKNRYGASNVDVKLAFDGEHSRFMEITPPKKKSSTTKKEAK